MKIGKKAYTWMCISAILFSSCSTPYEKREISGNPEYSIVVDKSEHRLEVKKHEKGIVETERMYDVATGRNAGDKIHEGDCKTPSGRYYIKKVMSNDSNSIFYDNYLVHLNNRFNSYMRIDGKPLGYDSYGPVALVLNYPNNEDIKQGKTGSRIWIHGTSDPGSIGKNASHGCLRMHNSDILELLNYVGNGTEVVIRP